MKVIRTDDGSSTVVSDLFGGQLYHSERGALGEAEHVYIRFLEDGMRVLEVGFGSGLNTLLSLETGLRLSYTTVELYPISSETIEELSFVSDSLRALHAAKWGEWVSITEDFTFRKLHVDITESDALPDESFDIVFFDAFAPDVVPEQWSEEVFGRVASRMASGAKLLTYSAKGDVKRALRAAGLEVKRLQGALGKHNMVMATKP